MAAPQNNARRQSFIQYVRSSVVTLQQTIISAQTARDETKATSWGRLVHCCTTLGYALALSSGVALTAAWFSSFDWVRRSEDGEPSFNNDTLAFLLGVMGSLYTLSTYFNIANGLERSGERGGPRYARWVLVVGAVMCPAVYGWFWALEHEAGIDARYSLVPPPTLFIWCALFIVMDIAGRQKWSEYNHRITADGLEAAGVQSVQSNDGIIKSPRGADPDSAQFTSTFTDTIIGLIVAVAGFSACALCECSTPIAPVNFTPRHQINIWRARGNISTSPLFDERSIPPHHRSNLHHPPVLPQRASYPPYYLPIGPSRFARSRRSSGSRHEGRHYGASTAHGEDQVIRGCC